MKEVNLFAGVPAARVPSQVSVGPPCRGGLRGLPRPATRRSGKKGHAAPWSGCAPCRRSPAAVRLAAKVLSGRKDLRLCHKCNHFIMPWHRGLGTVAGGSECSGRRREAEGIKDGLTLGQTESKCSCECVTGGGRVHCGDGKRRNVLGIVGIVTHDATVRSQCDDSDSRALRMQMPGRGHGFFNIRHGQARDHGCFAFVGADYIDA